VILRQGHFSEARLIEVVVAGDRPIHLDRCERCATRAVELGRWLDEVRGQAVNEAEALFPAERLAAQQAQIARRLEQVDEPVRVIAFPSAAAASARVPGMRRVAPAWVGVAAAAGLVIGVVGGQMTARMGHTPVAATSTAAVTAAVATPVNTAVVRDPAGSDLVLDAGGSRAGTELLDEGAWERYIPAPLQNLEDATPRLVQSNYAVTGSR
jgi:hypothetical protein